MWEGRATGVGYGDSQVMVLGAEGDYMNIGSSSADHMLTKKANLHISSSAEKIDAGGGVLFRLDHGNQPLGQPTMLVTGSGLTGIGTSTPSARLHISSSGQAPLLRIDATEQDTNLPILFVTGSGLVAIGTDAPRTDSGDTNRLHILGESGASQGRDPVVNTVLMLENNSHAGIQFMTPTTDSGFICWGDADAARRAHFYYHHSVDRFTFDGNVFGTTNVMSIRGAGDSVNMGSTDFDMDGSNKACLHISSSTGGTGKGGPVLLKVDHKDQPLNESLLFITGSGHVGIGTSNPRNRLEVVSTGSQARFSHDADNFATLTVSSNGDLTITGSAMIVSGAFGNTDFETRSTNYSILSPSGTSVVDTTSLANNATYIYSIEDGSFVGQEKKIFGKITFIQGQTTNSNALMITGSNIEGTDFGQGFVTAFLSGTAGTGGMSLVWSGTKWLCVGQNNFTLQ